MATSSARPTVCGDFERGADGQWYSMIDGRPATPRQRRMIAADLATPRTDAEATLHELAAVARAALIMDGPDPELAPRLRLVLDGLASRLEALAEEV